MKYEDISDFKYRITETFSIKTSIKPIQTVRSSFSTLSTTGRLYIKKGFLWDGASGAIDTDNIMRGSACHDAGCSMYLKGLITDEMRGQFDDLLYKLIKQDGMSDIRARWVYKAVKANSRIRYGI